MYKENRNNIPPWARRIDDFGRKHWNQDKQKNKRRGEYITAILFNAVFLWIVNKIPEWNPGFIRDNFLVVLWVINMNIFVQMGGNVLMLLIDHPGIRYLARIILEAASFITQIVIFYIYPFDFSAFHDWVWLDWLIPIMLIIGMVVSALKVLSNLWKLIFWRQ